MTIITVPFRKAGTAAVAGGTTVVGLGVAAAVQPAVVADTWFIIGGAAICLLAVGVLGLRRAVNGLGTARRALSGSAVATALFGLAHFYALVDADLAILAFSVFMVLASIGMIVASIAILRSTNSRGWTRLTPLLCGVWPVATIPAGAAIGDLPHFLAIAVWGVCWVALGASLLTAEFTPASRQRHDPGIGVPSGGKNGS
jgi:hypothetical protein